MHTAVRGVVVARINLPIVAIAVAHGHGLERVLCTRDEMAYPALILFAVLLIALEWADVSVKNVDVSLLYKWCGEA